MKKWWLVQNLMYDVKHVVRARWWKYFFIAGPIIDKCEAKSKKSAAAIFSIRGYQFGYYSEFSHLDNNSGGN